ncbi:hypothetical protein CR513_34893, partial [Mucuna pruriens]
MTMSLLIHSPETSFFSKIVHNPNPIACKLQNLKPLTNGKGIGLKLSCKVKDLNENLSWYGEFSVPVKRGSEGEEKQKYKVNLGYAIWSLREEFPSLFYRELSFDIYRDDIVFKDPLNTFVGIENYRSILWALRFHGRIFFKALWIDLIRVWQPVDNIIMVRWTVHGIPRVPWETCGSFDGTSEYKLDNNAKIFEHRFHNVALNSHPKFEVLRVQEFIQFISRPSTPTPTYFDVLLLIFFQTVLA